jgi:hypothetical protein
MRSDLEDLQLTEPELERLSGVEVGELFIGGVFGGVCRSSVFRQRRRIVLFCLAEMIVAVLVFVFSLPIGLLLIRNATTGVQDLPAILQFLQPPLGMTGIVMIGWNLYLWQMSKRFQTLMHLLDEVDRFNEVIQAVDLLDQLVAAGNTQIQLPNREQVLEGLRVTRDSLTAGLMTEKILRNHRRQVARRQDLLAAIETNLATLSVLEVNNQATEYGQLLREALEIGLSVRQEVEKISRF